MSEITTTEHNQTSPLVKVNGKDYSLSVAPDYKDELVQQEVKSVLGQLSLEDITENLDLAVELFYVAYNGVAGAKGGTLQAEIADLQSKLALLSNECVLTMTEFQEQTKNIINELLQTYSWLIRGKEQLAITKLSHCSESSTKMSTSAKALAEKFKDLQVRSTQARSNTIEQEASERDRKLAAEKAERDMLTKQKAEQANQTELVEQIGEMQQLYDEAKSREERESTKTLVLGITSAVTNAIGAGLGAYAAARNPMAMLAAASGASTAGTSSTQLADAQKNETEKKKLADDAQQKLLAAKDEQTKKQNKVNELSNALEELKKKVSEKEQDPSTKAEDLKKLKDERDAKQTALTSAKSELETANSKVQTLDTSAKEALAAYGAVGAALQSLSKSTGQMAASAATAEESIHQEKMKYLNQKLDLEKEKRKSLVALAEYAESIKNFKVEEGAAEASVNSLHAAVEALGKIIGTLTNASLFWDQMAAYCKRMTEQGFQQDIKDLTDPTSGLTLAERVAEYEAPYFMEQFLRYLSQWVAVNGLSGQYLVAAGEAQKKAVKYIGQSPTIEEAIKKAPQLAKNLAAILEKDLTASRQISVDLEQQKSLIEHKS
jgi:hypothetical protein